MWCSVSMLQSLSVTKVQHLLVRGPVVGYTSFLKEIFERKVIAKVYEL